MLYQVLRLYSIKQEMKINRRNVEGRDCGQYMELPYNIPSTNLRLLNHYCASCLMHRS
jgi:hypothetical protein